MSGHFFAEFAIKKNSQNNKYFNNWNKILKFGMLGIIKIIKEN